MKKNLMYIFSFLIVGLVLMSFNQKAKETYYGDVSKDGFKNLKILPKDISKDSLMTLMKGYSKALGVKCTHCHTLMDKASDDKHEKEIARHMIKFTDELNAREFAPIGDNYKNAIQCATCHRGSTKPIDDTKAFMLGKEEKKS